MTKDTSALIMCLKGNCNFECENATGKNITKAFISDYYDVPYQKITDDNILRILKAAVVDYAKTMTQGFSLFMYECLHGSPMSTSEIDKLSYALCMTNVRNKGEFINGFNEGNTQNYIAKRKLFP